jgi:hypothetical protein
MRLVIDHLAKTGGQSVNAVLRDIGGGAYIGDLIGTHRDILRRYGGTYQIISAHLTYEQWDTLMPKDWSYMTVLRDPVERAFSSIFYLANNVKPDSPPGALRLQEDARAFIKSEGECVSHHLKGNISNYYVSHFGAAAMHDNSMKSALSIESALEVITRYSAIGFTDQLGSFINLFTGDRPVSPYTHSTVPHVNATLHRPHTRKLSAKLRDHVANLNNLDIEFYERVKRRVYPLYADERINLYKHLHSDTSRSNRWVFFCADFPMKTTVGRISNEGVHSQGEHGCMLFGPHMPLPAGTYTVSLIGKIEGPCEGLLFEVSANCGQDILISQQIKSWHYGQPLAQMTVRIDTLVTHVEARFHYTGSAQVLLKYVDFQLLSEVCGLSDVVRK